MEIAHPSKRYPTSEFTEAEESNRARHAQQDIGVEAVVNQALLRGASCDEHPSGEILTPDGSLSDGSHNGSQGPPARCAADAG